MARSRRSWPMLQSTSSRTTSITWRARTSTFPRSELAFRRAQLDEVDAYDPLFFRLEERAYESSIMASFGGTVTCLLGDPFYRVHGSGSLLCRQPQVDRPDSEADSVRSAIRGGGLPGHDLPGAAPLGGS